MSDWVRRQAQQRPDHPAVIDDQGHVVTFAALEQLIVDQCRKFQQARVPSAAVLFSLLPAGPDFVVLLHAARRLGATLAVASPGWTATEIERAVKLSAPDWVFMDAFAGEAARVAAQASGAKSFRREFEKPGPTPPPGETLPEPNSDLQRPFTLLFTSGTSGKAKAIVHSAANYQESTMAGVRRLGSRDDDVWLAAMPLHHVGGLAILVRCAILGTTVRLQNGFDPDRVAESLLSGNITQASVVPAMIDPLLDALDGRRVPSQLRFVLVGGAMATEEQLARAQKAGLPVAPTYGMTETTSQIATARPGTGRFRSGEVGEPLDVTEVRVVDSRGARSTGGTGAIEVRGPTLGLGRLEAPGQMQSLTDEDGWMRTMDKGTLDPSGVLQILGRMDDVIVTGGENVSPGEVEAILSEHPEVAQIAVIGRPHERWGSAVTAVIVPASGARPSVEGLRHFAAGRLARHKLPHAVEIRDDLPRTTSGKLQRHKLRKGFGGGVSSA